MSRIWVLTDERYLGQRMPAALVEWLEAEGHEARVVVADGDRLVSPLAGALTPRTSAPWAELEPGELVVVRSRHPFALALLHQAEACGARSMPSSSSILEVRNKVRAALVLRARGLPVPPTLLARRPEDLRSVSADLFPLVLKPFQGDNARGIEIVNSAAELQDVEWSEQLLLAQPYVDTGGVELKLYVAGERVWAVRRTSPLLGGEASERVATSRELRELALRCAAAFDLQLAGIDVLEGPDGPVVVDVNEFPNYTGVDEAPEAVGALLVGAATLPREPLGAVAR